MSNIFITADSHAHHRNISGPKVSAWKDGYRNFNDEAEMTRHIVKVWNQTVAEDDVLYHLGDFSFGGIQNIWNFRKQLRCKTIHLVLGNHDHHIEANKLLPNVIYTDGGLVDNYLNYGKDKEERNNVYAKELYTSVNDVLTFKVEHHTFFCSHYAHRIWLGSHKGICHLYGHNHGSLPDFGKSMDCGVDVAKRLLGDYRPFNVLTEIIPIMDAKQIAFVDHHNSRTNIR